MYPNVKLQLWRSGIRQNLFAKMLGLDETCLSRILNGYREPSPELRAKIAAVLERDEKWLFEPLHAPKQKSRKAVAAAHSPVQQD